MKTHYETLGVSKKASQEEIKAAFRKLSLETHPDLKKESSCADKFKQIANAHSILSSPNERRKYDRELQEELMWGRGQPGFNRQHDFYNSNNIRRPGHRPKPGMHVAMETLSNPRYVFMGMAGFAGVAFLGALLGGSTSNRPEYHHHEPLVEAWKNPKTGQWEQPAPWDPVYRQLKPKLEMVPREKVRQRIR
jgi:curved DNA-binding protein CbpA